MPTCLERPFVIRSFCRMLPCFLHLYELINPTVVFFRSKITIEAIHGLMSQVLKDRIFNRVVSTPSVSSLDPTPIDLDTSKTESVVSMSKD